MIANLLVIAGGYLCGALPFAALAGRLLGDVDVQRQGSGNPGATNVLRILGWKAALLVLVVDSAKGWMAAGLLPRLVADDPAAPWLPAAAGLAAVVGHVRPPARLLRGGKGVATTAGATLALAPLALPLLLALFLAVVTVGRRVSLGSLAAALALLPALWLLAPDDDARPYRLAFGAGAGLLVLLAHRANIARLAAGREPKLGD